MGTRERTAGKPLPGRAGRGRRSILTLFPVMLLLAGCCTVDMKEARFEPPYLCTGETLTFHYKDGRGCLKGVWLYTNNYMEELGSANTSVGAITTNRGVQRADLPLQIVGFTQDANNTIRYLPRIIDNPDWTESYYVNAMENALDINYNQGSIIWADTKMYVHDRTEYVCSYGDMNCSPQLTVDVWKVYDKIAGYSWTVPDWHYSSRARAINFDNGSNYEMAVTPPGGSTTMTIGSSPGADWTTSYNPWGTWVGMFTDTSNLTEVYLGEYWGDYNTPHKPPSFEEEGMHAADIPNFAEMKLKVKCN